MVSASRDLGNHAIDQAQLGKIRSGDFHGIRSLGRVLAVLPENRGTTFGTNHRIVGVLHHEDSIGHAYSQSPTGATLTQHDRDNGNFEQHHFAEIAGDGLSNVSFLGPNTRKGSGGIDERHDGQ